jgi:putative copper resistance protein D
MDPSALPMALLRGASLAAVMCFFGVLFFAVRLDLPPSDQATTLRRALRKLARISACLAVILGVAWFILEARMIAGATSIGETFAALWPVTLYTQFGPWLLFRIGLVIVALLFAGSYFLIGLVLAAIALGLQPMLAHAGAIGGGIGLLLTVSEALHMLAAGAWLGGLLPLALVVAILPAPLAVGVSCRYSALAFAAVLLLIGTGVVQSEVLLGSVQALTHTPYGHMLVPKLGLIAVALSFAALNRFRFVPRLIASLSARRWMPRTVRTEAVAGLCIVLAAGWLGSLAPGTEPNVDWGHWRFVVLAVAAIVALIAMGLAARSAGLWRARLRRRPPYRQSHKELS